MRRGENVHKWPLPPKDVRWLVDVLWPPYEAFINGPEPVGQLRNDWVEHRRRLKWLLAGESPLPGQRVYLPLVIDQRGKHYGHRQYWGLLHPPGTDGQSQELRLTLMLLWHPSIRVLVRQCDFADCGRFFLGKRRHRRKREFCSDRCRYAFNRPSKGDAAAYMKKYRDSLKRRKKHAKKR